MYGIRHGRAKAGEVQGAGQTQSAIGRISVSIQIDPIGAISWPVLLQSTTMGQLVPLSRLQLAEEVGRTMSPCLWTCAG